MPQDMEPALEQTSWGVPYQQKSTATTHISSTRFRKGLFSGLHQAEAQMDGGLLATSIRGSQNRLRGNQPGSLLSRNALFSGTGLMFCFRRRAAWSGSQFQARTSHGELVTWTPNIVPRKSWAAQNGGLANLNPQSKRPLAQPKVRMKD